MGAIALIALPFSLPADFGIHRRYREWGKLNFLPGSVIVSILFVAASRLLDVQPGYFYGALDGRKVLRWSRTAWSLLFFVGVFATVHVLLRPGSGYVGKTSGTVTIGVMVLYAAFGIGSAAFWAYFRYRPQRWVAANTLDV